MTLVHLRSRVSYDTGACNESFVVVCVVRMLTFAADEPFKAGGGEAVICTVHGQSSNSNVATLSRNA